MEDEWLTSGDAAAFLGVHVDSLRYLRRTGQGPGYMQGKDGTYQYLQSELERYRSWITRRERDEAAAGAPMVQLAPPEPIHDPWAFHGVTGLVDAALQAAQDDEARDQQRTEVRPDPRNAIQAAQDAARAAIRAVLGVDADPGMRLIMHAGEPSEVDCTVQGLRLVFDIISCSLFYLSQPDDNRHLVRNKADLGRAIQEERRLNGDFLLRPEGDAASLFFASRDRT
jgi:hypothetical protein